MYCPSGAHLSTIHTATRLVVGPLKTLRWFVIFSMLSLVGCDGCSDGTLGDDGESSCVVCIQRAPYFTDCLSVSVASGGQPVCVSRGEVIPCESARICTERGSGR